MIKILMQDILDNKEVGKILDWWNNSYEFEIYVSDKGKLYRKDLQSDEIVETNVNNMIKFYVEEIENKAHYNKDTVMKSFGLDLDLLKKYLSQQNT